MINTMSGRKSEIKSERPTPTCPKCKKTLYKQEHGRVKIWKCPNFPSCMYTQPFNPIVIKSITNLRKHGKKLSRKRRKSPSFKPPSRKSPSQSNNKLESLKTQLKTLKTKLKTCQEKLKSK